MKNKDVNMLSGSIFKGLLAMSIPIMIMNVCQSLYNIIDMTVLGNFADDTAVGAVGACGVLISLTTSFLIGIATGSNVVIAKNIGVGNKESAERAVGTSVLFGVVSGFALAILGFVFAGGLLNLANCPQSLMSQATLYFRLYFCSVPPLMLYNFCAAVLRAKGDTRRPMYILLTSGAIKVLLTVFFVAVLEMSVVGVGLATIISNLCAGVVSFYSVKRSESNIKFYFKHFKFYSTELKKILFIGVPTGIQSSLWAVANVVIATAVNKYGPDATTGISIANQYDGLLYHICYATPIAAMPYIAQNIGAKNIKRAKQTVWKAMLLTAAFGASFGALSAIFSKELSAIMSSSPEVIRYSQEKMIIISSTYFICGIHEIMNAALRALGRPIIPTVSTLVFMCGLRVVWVYFLFPLCPNFTFLYLVWPVGWILSIITALIFYFPTMSKLKKQIEKEKTVLT